MVMDSKHISHLIQRNFDLTRSDEDAYTGGCGLLYILLHPLKSRSEHLISDSVVLKGIKKAALDHSIKLARTTKELLPTNERAVSERESESTDHPWISRKVGHICV